MQPCVKNQAARGTCVSFAVTAGVEIGVIKSGGRWPNLSEQNFYKNYKAMWQDPSGPVDFPDGAYIFDAVSSAYSKKYIFRADLTDS
mmetsp:Transcript_37087/g.60073  ORF Transcript_37087/g.60073 Transcript_37087/m.60073 type:complete len:87 (+) Transcript_37087:444-704(+)